MEMVRGVVLFCLTIALCGAARKARVADKDLVQSRLKYPWVVNISITYRIKTKTWAGVRSTSCTGSFIDKYWSIVTAAHCVLPKKKCPMYGKHAVCILQSVRVMWPSRLLSKRLREVEVRQIDRDIAIFKHPLRLMNFWIHDPEQRLVWGDIALIFLPMLRMFPMTCRKQSLPQPIKLSKLGTPPDYPRDGTVAGYGIHPSGYNPSTKEYTYEAGDMKMSEIALKFDAYDNPGRYYIAGKWRKGKMTPLFIALAQFSQISSPNAIRHPFVKGTCVGDSGGPYMVKDYTGLRLRGVLRGGKRYREKAEAFGKLHPCNEFSSPNYFTDVNYKRIRDWLVKEVKKRYDEMQISYSRSRIPTTCSTNI